jgi:hypothetical protein
MEATLAMASLGRFNPDEPHLKMTVKYKKLTLYTDPLSWKKFRKFFFGIDLKGE